jgi:phage terminase large subunit-like protein
MSAAIDLVAAIGRLALHAPKDQAWAIARLTIEQKWALKTRWIAWAHEGQIPPPGDWRIRLMMAGRGFGKTRAGAEWVSALARADGSVRIALVGATLAEVERVMVRGESGLINVAWRGEEPVWHRSRGVVAFASGAQAFAYSGANPDGLRGPEHHFAWCDELAKWAYPQEAFDNLMVGLRLGDGARALVTTTPRPIGLLRRLAGASDLVLARGRTADNFNLPPKVAEDLSRRYGGTRFARQELDGELIEDAEGAMWKREAIEKGRVEMATVMAEGFFERIVIGVDPPASAGGDECGIVACGLGADGIGYVLGDHSVGGLGPEGWARAVVDAAEQWEADLVIAETNQGGEMVESVLRSVDSDLPVQPVWARYGKGRRAEPVSGYFAQGKAKLAGAFPVLEDQLCGMTGAGYQGPGRSPDRADAMVWAMAELLLGGGRGPRIRRL